MKKVLALVLVLGMASMASAAFQISVHPSDGTPANWDPMNPQNSQITIKPSETLRLDIWTDAPLIIGDFPGYAMLTVNRYGTIAGGEIVGPADPTNPDNRSYFIDTPDNTGVSGVPEGMNGVAGFVGVLDGTAIPAGTVLFDYITFHCEEVGDAVITLYSLDSNFGVSAALDQVIIHQIPEPMTLSLLTLGGLGLIRRRRA